MTTCDLFKAIFVSYIFITGLYNSTVELVTNKDKNKTKTLKFTELKKYTNKV